MGTYANSSNPVQTLQNVASELGLCRLLTGISMQNTTEMKIPTRNPENKKWTDPNDNDEQITSQKRG